MGQKLLKINLTAQLRIWVIKIIVLDNKPAEILKNLDEKINRVPFETIKKWKKLNSGGLHKKQNYHLIQEWVPRMLLNA